MARRGTDAVADADVVVPAYAIIRETIKETWRRRCGSWWNVVRMDMMGALAGDAVLVRRAVLVVIRSW
jgi:hypothetical protein